MLPIMSAASDSLSSEDRAYPPVSEEKTLNCVSARSTSAYLKTFHVLLRFSKKIGVLRTIASYHGDASRNHSWVPKAGICAIITFLRRKDYAGCVYALRL